MKLLDSLLKGFASIGEGMSYISFYPVHRHQMPTMTPEEALAHDRKMIEQDWTVVMSDFDTVLKRKNLSHLIRLTEDAELYEK